MGRRSAGGLTGRRARHLTSGGLALGLIGALTTIVAMTSGASATAAVCADAAATPVDAARMAKQCHRRVTILSSLTEFEQTTIGPDGSMATEIALVPQRVRRGDGSWSAVDLSLRIRPDGSIAPAASAVDVSFSAGGSAPLVTLRSAGHTLTLSWPGDLPAPALAGDSAIYAVAPDAELVVRATHSGFSQNLIIKSRAAATNPALRSVRYRIGGDATVRSRPDGGLIVSAGGTLVATAAPPSMWDSATDAGPPGKLDGNGPDREALAGSSVRGAGPRARVARVGAGVQAGHLVVSANAALLDSPAARFPIFIDPSFSASKSRVVYANSANINGPWDDPTPVSGDTAGDQVRVGKDPYDGKIYRSFLEFPMNSGGNDLRGKHILSAKVTGKVDHTWKCNSNRPVNFYRSATPSAADHTRQTWAGPSLQADLGTEQLTANETSCGQPNVAWEMADARLTTDLQARATAMAATYTVAMSARDFDGTSESDGERWMRFFLADFRLVATYNTVPGTPANLSPHQGQVACGGVVGTYSPVLRAQYVDANPGDTLTATFSWQQLPSGTVTSGAGTSAPANNFGTKTLSLGSGAEGKSYRFQVRTHDGHDYSPWSAWCTFTVDTIAPPAPIVTPVASGSAPVYVACDPVNIASCVARGGPGVAGAFTFSEPSGSAGQDVIKYVYGWDSATVQVTVSPGAPYGPVKLTPPHYGLNTLDVYSVDGSGKASPTTAFRFLVNAPSAAVAYWPLDDINGHGLTDQVSQTALTTTGDVSWKADARYIGANALSFDANPNDGQSGYASTSGPVLDTTKSFGVSAWVRLADLSQYRHIVSQDGATRGRFTLYYSSGSHAWGFAMYDSPDTSSGAFALGGTPVLGQWTHLVGFYDADTKQIGLYVNGVLVEAESHTPVWSATGPLSIGRVYINGTSGPWRGEIAEVRVWQRVVVPDDIWGTDADPVNGVPAQVGLLHPTQVGWWSFADAAECSCTDSGDGAYFGRRLYLDPGWNGDPDTSPSWFTGDSYDATPGAVLLRTGGYAATTQNQGTATAADDVHHPVLRTDQSFTVSAAVKVAALTGADQVVLRQGIGTQSAVKLLLGTDNKFRIQVYSPNGTGGYTSISARANVAAQADTWVHVVGVFDAAMGQVRLYINGQLQTNTQSGGLGFFSTDGLYVGANENGASGYLGGTIDQVQLWQGVLSDREILDEYQNAST